MTYLIRTIIESPYAARSPAERRIYDLYARRAMAHSLSQGEAPIAFHMLYTQRGVLQDAVASERKLGMQAAQSWYESADLVAVYDDYGVSNGMQAGMTHAKLIGLKVIFRKIGVNPRV